MGGPVCAILARLAGFGRSLWVVRATTNPAAGIGLVAAVAGLRPAGRVAAGTGVLGRVRARPRRDGRGRAGLGAPVARLAAAPADATLDARGARAQHPLVAARRP